MEPINFEHANQHLSGGNGGSLPVNKFEHDGRTYQLSIWRASIAERLAVLLTGRVQLMVRAEKHPIVAVSAGFGVREYETRPASGAADYEACPVGRHEYYKLLLSYAFCPYCGQRLHRS